MNGYRCLMVVNIAKNAHLIDIVQGFLLDACHCFANVHSSRYSFADHEAMSVRAYTVYCYHPFADKNAKR